jgi:DNA-binding transcriptional LysR family regulator
MGNELTESQIDTLFDQIGMRSFEAFYEVVETGGFSPAAESLNLTQPTVSQHVKNLERVLGTPLIVRDGTDITLTSLGEICYEKLKTMNAAKSDLKDEIKSYYNTQNLKLHVASSTIPGEFILPASLPRYLSNHPDVRVRLTIDDSEAVIDQLDEGSVRWGITGRCVDRSALEFTPLLVDEMVLVGQGGPSRDTPIGYDDLRELNYVGRNRESGTQRAVEERISDAGYTPDELLEPVARFGTIQAVRSAVVNGLGVSFLPLCAIQHDIESGRLDAIATDFPTIERTFYGVKNRFLGVPPIVESFERFLENQDQVGSLGS